MSFTTFADAENIVDRFIQLLHRHGITPAIGSQIESEILSPLQLLESTRNLGKLVNNPELLADAGGMYDLAAKVLAVETQPEFQSFIPHLKLFEAEAEFSTAVQPKNSDIRDDVNRKLAELYLGTLAVHFAFNVQLDHPVNSRGDNPDVMFEVRPTSLPPSRWALAIKTLSSRSGQTIFENIEKAAKQIDAISCPAERGMVVINLKSSIQHDQLWQRGTYSSLADAQAALQSQIDSLIAATENGRPPSEWLPLFAKRTAPLVFYFAQAVVRLRLPSGQEVPTILKIAKLANPLGRQDQVAELIAGLLNEGMQKLLRGIPGTAGQLPQ